MQRTRAFTQQRMYGMGFIVIVLTIIFGIHSSFVFIVWGPKLWSPGAVAILFVFHLFFANLLVSFYQCVMTDPGIVPPNWGFYMGDETKRRRYCKMCNVWKPDRTHHCSICSRCILNMDHHCPWINNCVGFYNRKFFIQLLVYVYISLAIVVVFAFPEICDRVAEMTRSASKYQSTGYCISSLILAMAFCMALLLICTLTNFIKFHMKLVLENYTTIENLEREVVATSPHSGLAAHRRWRSMASALHSRDRRGRRAACGRGGHVAG
eukprot:TRINITY_DN2042_c0_g2_i2.p1 TRINITY_DN2042_c0_g2~~TRINITY_DN2042_c0_g2_i2.p1  ORF type:complete len:290 (+),score=20.97 TRINITY_DN2042_c0_g2_i2:73-870(+)